VCDQNTVRVGNSNTLLLRIRRGAIRNGVKEGDRPEGLVRHRGLLGVRLQTSLIRPATRRWRTKNAYLKAHYPIEYMTALLSVERNNADKVGFLVTECRRMEIPILPPDVNHSELDFSIESCETKDGDCKSGIRFGLGRRLKAGPSVTQKSFLHRKAPHS
jgi:hypothetical protein